LQRSNVFNALVKNELCVFCSVKVTTHVGGPGHQPNPVIGFAQINSVGRNVFGIIIRGIGDHPLLVTFNVLPGPHSSEKDPVSHSGGQRFPAPFTLQ
jgi:hypothetical protein